MSLMSRLFCGFTGVVDNCFERIIRGGVVWRQVSGSGGSPFICEVKRLPGL